MQSTANTDRAAIALNVACIVHCLALPLLAFVLPVVGTLAEIEAIHIVLAVFAVFAAVSVPLRSADARGPGFLVPAGGGIALIIGALFAERFGLSETLPTVLGGLLLSYAHLGRLIPRHSH